MPTDTSTVADGRTSRRGAARRALRPLVGLVGVAIAGWVIVGRRDELVGAAGALGRLRWGWVALGLVAEASSFVMYAQLERRLFGHGGLGLTLGSVLPITFAGNAIQNSFPGGAAWAGVFAFGQFRRRGADEVLAAWAMVVVALLSDTALAVLAAIGLLVAGSDASSLGLGGAIFGVLAVTVAVAVAVLRRRRSSAGATGRVAVRVLRLSRRLVGRPRDDPRRIVVTAMARVHAFSPDRRAWSRLASLAVLNWLFDLACLGTSFFAVGAALPWRGLLLAYGAAQLAAALPITPGGLGVVEGSLAIALVFYGGLRQSTVAAVLLYRIISFWLPLPIGWASWAALSWRAHTTERSAA